MPQVGDELHHFGWNCLRQLCRRTATAATSSSPASPRAESTSSIPGNPACPKLHKVIEPADVIAKSKLTAPHTVHCLSDGRIMLSMLGNDKGDGPGGFLMMNDKFEVTGPWEASLRGMNFNYDFWYQPRHNVMVSSEWAAPNTVSAASSSTTSRQASTASACTSGTGRSGRSPRRSTSAATA